jgi:hypothetical protein
VRLRRLIVDGSTFLWGCSHEHSAGRCREIVHVYREGFKKAPARLAFDWPGERASGAAGVVLIPDPVNLNKPSVVASLIRAALARGWQPETEQRPRFLDIRDLLSTPGRGVS